MIMLSRNAPVSLVVGGAGFLGSHLVEKLLEKRVQVVAVDDLSLGLKENLEEAVKNKNFCLLSKPIQEITDLQNDLKLSRLDYAFFMISENSSAYRQAFEKFLQICQPLKAKIILVSNIELYDQNNHSLPQLREVEKKLADFALKNKVNARVVRLASTFGPRMNFGGYDPMERLIKEAILENLQSQSLPLDFTTRSLFVEDAVDLLIKAVMHGGTVWKIYDGAQLYPVKVVEVKQVLLDPLWHENRQFQPTELPPWPTPNLVKTMKELVWKPSTPLVTALKKTVSFFKEHPERIKKEVGEQVEVKKEQTGTEEKIEERKIKSFWQEKQVERKPEGVGWGKKIGQLKRQTFLFLVMVLVLYTFIWPVVTLVYQVVSVPKLLASSSQRLLANDFSQAENHAKEAVETARRLVTTFSSWRNLIGVGFLKSSLEKEEQQLKILEEITLANQEAVLGLKYFRGSWLRMAGETGDARELMKQSNNELTQAEKRLNLILGEISASRSLSAQILPRIINSKKLSEDVLSFEKMVNLGQGVSFLLAEALDNSEETNYLILLTDNRRLRQGGGTVEALAEIVLKNNKIEKITTSSTDTFDKKLASLGVGDRSLKEVVTDPDFPSNARMAEWLYQKNSQKAAASIITLDLVALSQFLEILGPVSLPDSAQTISQKNLASELSSAKSSGDFLAAVLKEVLDRAFFLSELGWFKLAQAVEESFTNKRLMVYFADPTRLSYSTIYNFTGEFPKQKKGKEGEKEEFLALLETDLGNNGAFSSLAKTVDLKSEVGSKGQGTHKLTINYLSGEEVGEPPSNTQLKGKLTVYLAGGTKLTRAMWGKEDILKKVASFSDYGRAGYNLDLGLEAGEGKSLLLEYEDPQVLKLETGQMSYSLRVIKQPSKKGGKFDYRLQLPAGWRAEAVPGVRQRLEPNSFSGSLDQDLNLEMILKKENSL